MYMCIYLVMRCANKREDDMEVCKGPSLRPLNKRGTELALKGTAFEADGSTVQRPWGRKHFSGSKNCKAVGVWLGCRKQVRLALREGQQEGRDRACLARTSAHSWDSGSFKLLLCEVWRGCRKLVNYYNDPSSRQWQSGQKWGMEMERRDVGVRGRCQGTRDSKFAAAAQ